MIELIHFILFSGIFWGIYYWLLRKETFFHLNRIYLLVTPLLAILLPFFKIEQFSTASAAVATVNLPSIWIADSTTALEETSSGFNLTLLLLGIYGIGFLISGVLFLYKIIKIQQLKKMGRLDKSSGIIWLPGTQGAFSFWGTAFIGDELKGEPLDQILLHEREHIRQKHSLDLCYYEILRVLFWFNPFFALMHRHLAETHEFAVDQKMVRIKSKKDYINSLLNVNFQTQQLAFTNSFLTQNQLKTRIMMLYKKSSHRLAKLKYMGLLPLLVLMAFYVSCTADSDHDPITESQNQRESWHETGKKTHSGKTSETLPFSVIETSPEFPDAPEFQDEEERKKAFSNKIQEFVSDAFNTEVIAKEEGKKIYRIHSQFTIDEKGQVIHIKVRSDQPELEKEAQRVLAGLPDFKPAQMEGHSVPVVFQLPIVFKQ